MERFWRVWRAQACRMTRPAVLALVITLAGCSIPPQEYGAPIDGESDSLCEPPEYDHPLGGFLFEQNHSPCGSANFKCVDGIRVSVPDCEGKECSSDGCGGTCPCRWPKDECSEGKCVCVPDCAGRECGPDDCGGWCGDCPEGVPCDFSAHKCTETPSDMVFVDAGIFRLGCNVEVDKFCSLGEFPHDVQVHSYYIDKTEVTTQQYRPCLLAGSCTPDETSLLHSNLRSAGKWGHPMNYVSWHDASQYCAWAGKRLCTEAEWEIAARGDDQRVFPWGNSAPTCARAVMWDTSTGEGCGLGGTWPAGFMLEGASPYGALDMAGNVSEWVHDWYGPYNAPSLGYGRLVEPQGPSSGTHRVVRGGSYGSLMPSSLRSSDRADFSPEGLQLSIGFRCCRDAKP